MIEYFKEFFICDAEKGILYWNKTRNGSAKKGSEAGCLTKYGYIRIHLNGKLYMAHKIIWLFNYGCWPDFPIDHVNGDRSDNRISNLRKSSYKENNRNAAKRKDNTTGLTGVNWVKATNKWAARIYNDEGKRCSLGHFDNLLDAASARISAQNKLGYDTLHGKRTSSYENTK